MGHVGPDLIANMAWSRAETVMTIVGSGINRASPRVLEYSSQYGSKTPSRSTKQGN
jgi:hypothetical protein